MTNLHTNYINTFDMLASIVPKLHACDGFIVHPCSLQSGTQQAKQGCLLTGAPSAIEVACLSSKFGTLAAALCHGSGKHITLSSNNCTTNGKTATSDCWQPKLVLHGLSFHTERRLNAGTVEPSIMNTSQNVYVMEWRTADHWPNASKADFFKLAMAALQIKRSNVLPPSQAASLAAANAVQMLQARHSHDIDMKAFTLVSFGSVSAHKQLAQGFPAAQGAAIEGILKNLPFEMPNLNAAVIDVDTESPASTSSYMLATVSPPAISQADLYGAAVRSGSLLKPVLTYTASQKSHFASDTVAIKCDRHYILTGGLGGIGLMTAHWLCCGGTNALTLTGRSGTTMQLSHPSIVSKHIKTQLLLVKCDVSVSEDAHLLACIVEGDSSRFGGVFHSAGVQVNWQQASGIPSKTTKGDVHTVLLNVICAAG